MARVESNGRRPRTGDAAPESRELERLVEDLVAALDVIEPSPAELARSEDASTRAIPEEPHLPIAAAGWRELDGFTRPVVPDAMSHPAGVEQIVDGLDDDFLGARSDDPDPVEVEGLRLDEPIEREDPPPVVLERFVEELDDDWRVGASTATANPAATEIRAAQERAVEELDDDWRVGGSTATVNRAATEIPPRQEPRRDPDEVFDYGKRSRPGVLLFAIAAVVAVAFAIVVVRGGGDGDRANVSTSRSESIDLEPISIGLDVDVDTAWTLTGVHGRLFQATLTFRNRSSSIMRATFQEVIPKSLAASVRKVVFLGPQPRVIERDPVLEYIVDLPPQTDVTRKYEISVAPNGFERVRFLEWAGDLATESTPRTGSVTAPVGPLPTFPPVNPEPQATAGSGRRGPTTTGRDPTRGSSRNEPGSSPGGIGSVDENTSSTPTGGDSTTSSEATTTTKRSTTTSKPSTTTTRPPPPPTTTTNPPPPPTTTTEPPTTTTEPPTPTTEPPTPTTEPPTPTT